MSREEKMRAVAVSEVDVDRSMNGCELNGTPLPAPSMETKGQVDAACATCACSYAYLSSDDGKTSKWGGAMLQACQDHLNRDDLATRITGFGWGCAETQKKRG